MIVEGLKYPIQKSNVIKVLLVGSLYTILSVFLIPIILLLGYFSKVIAFRHSKDTLPEITNVKELSVIGVKVLGIIVAYTTTVLVISAVFSGGILFFDEFDSLYRIIPILLFAFGIFFIMIIGLLLTIVAIVNFSINKHDLNSAFHGDEVSSLIYNRAFFKGIIIATVLYPLILSSILFVFSIVPPLLAVTVPLLYFYFSICIGFILGQSYRSAKSED